jgi:hypothetical protein
LVRARQTRDGKRTRPTLGAWPALGIADARKRALAQLAAIHGGADPVAQKRAARADRAAREAEPTVAERVAEWLAAREADRAKPLKPRTAAEYRRTMERDVLPRIGGRPLRETTREDWTGSWPRRGEGPRPWHPCSTAAPRPSSATPRRTAGWRRARCRARVWPPSRRRSPRASAC